jgi:uncharacterized protein HemX
MKTTVKKPNRTDLEKNSKKYFSFELIDNTPVLKEVKNEPETSKTQKMKQGKILTLAIAIGTAAIVMSCNSPAKNLENAESNVVEAKEDLSKAQEEYAADVRLFRLETDKKITANEKEIADINEKIKKSKSKQRSEYEKQIVVLEQKNKTLKQKMDDYKADTNKDWQLFKTEFNKDMDELGLALKNFVTESN